MQQVAGSSPDICCDLPSIGDAACVNGVPLHWIAIPVIEGLSTVECLPNITSNSSNAQCFNVISFSSSVSRHWRSGNDTPLSRLTSYQNKHTNVENPGAMKPQVSATHMAVYRSPCKIVLPWYGLVAIFITVAWQTFRVLRWTFRFLLSPLLKMPFWKNCASFSSSNSS
jgi:hypothetical protein